MDLVTPLWALILEPSAMVICPTMPACPPIMTLFAYFGTATYPGLCSNHRITADFYIMGDLDEIVEFGPGMDNR